jgi:hypothetical protein
MEEVEVSGSGSRDIRGGSGNLRTVVDGNAGLLDRVQLLRILLVELGEVRTREADREAGLRGVRRTIGNRSGCGAIEERDREKESERGEVEKECGGP